MCLQERLNVYSQISNIHESWVYIKGLQSSMTFGKETKWGADNS